MRLVCIFAALVTLATAQQLPKVDPPSAVDVNVSNVDWHPKGTALRYTKPEKDGGKAIGLFTLGQKEGAIVLHLAKDDRFESQWFEGQPLLAMIVYHNVVRNNVPSIEASIYTGDALAGTAFKLWTEVFPAKEGVSVNVDTSPILRHAIFRIQAGKTRYHMVLPAGGGARLVYARDLDQAVQAGSSGPTWSIDGTAVYSDAPEIQTGAQVTLDLGDQVKTAFRVQAEKIVVDGNSLLATNFKLWIAPPKPAVGAAVLELMPSNAVLRQVRFRGAWEERARQAEPLALITRPTNMQFGQASFIANSLWLTNEKDKFTGIMLAAHSDKAWMAPRNAGVAYTTDGALFVRAFQTDGR